MAYMAKARAIVEFKVIIKSATEDPLPRELQSAAEKIQFVAKSSQKNLKFKIEKVHIDRIQKGKAIK